ncbi:hypothetical protein EVAR_92121_1 [Eumeta japonica]|uniref:Uncharacterized protein n=1 Tax=Eumeta variegata TaxID=151549 RepID=A0A4C1T1A9_EUMVA|nr:hypothetical protein EVAR_92121_1 [Eumeta japonica]
MRDDSDSRYRLYRVFLRTNELVLVRLFFIVTRVVVRLTSAALSRRAGGAGGGRRPVAEGQCSRPAPRRLAHCAPDNTYLLTLCTIYKAHATLYLHYLYRLAIRHPM